LFCFPHIGPPGRFRLGFRLCPVHVEGLTGSLGLGTRGAGSCVTTKKKKREISEKKETIQMILTARFGEYTRFRSPHTSYTDFPHQQLASLFLLPTLCVVGVPPEFLVADIEHVASCSKAEGQLSLSPRQKGEMRAAEKSSSNSCAIVVSRQ